MRRLLLLMLAIFVLLILPQAVRQEGTVVQPHEDLINRRIYAYRGWQSSGFRINQGDWVQIQAEGTWLYTPDEHHGPEGHAVFPAPDFYPLPHVPGGVLIGRIGEMGPPLLISRGTNFSAETHGILYLRINDDILSDNDGWVSVQIDVTTAVANGE